MLISKTIIVLVTFIILCSTSIFTAYYCINDINNVIVSDNSKLYIRLKINKIITRNVTNTDKIRFNIRSDKFTYIYCKVEIKNTSSLKANYNLSQYFLSIGNKISSSLYIDSVANYIITDEPIDSNETVVKSVYWVFDGIVYPNDVRNIQLIVR